MCRTGCGKMRVVVWMAYARFGDARRYHRLVLVVLPLRSHEWAHSLGRSYQALAVATGAR